MSTKRDRDLGMHRRITQRDFVNGVGVAVGGALIAPGRSMFCVTEMQSRRFNV